MNIDVDMLAEAIVLRTVRRIPLSVDLWSYAEIADYLKVGVQQVADRYATLPDFPRAIRLPSQGSRRGHPRYKAIEIVRWAEKFQEVRR
jgi:hypothetical protein